MRVGKGRWPKLAEHWGLVILNVGGPTAAREQALHAHGVSGLDMHHRGAAAMRRAIVTTVLEVEERVRTLIKAAWWA